MERRIGRDLRVDTAAMSSPCAWPHLMSAELRKSLFCQTQGEKNHEGEDTRFGGRIQDSQLVNNRNCRMRQKAEGEKTIIEECLPELKVNLKCSMSSR